MGDTLHARCFKAHKVEACIGCLIRNAFGALEKTDTVKIQMLP